MAADSGAAFVLQPGKNKTARRGRLPMTGPCGMATLYLPSAAWVSAFRRVEEKLGGSRVAAG